MKTFFAFFAFLLTSNIIYSQIVGEYSLLCDSTNNTIRLVTPENTTGITIDTNSLKSQLKNLDLQLEEISIAEYELKLLRDKRRISKERELVFDIYEKSKTLCQD